MSLESVINFYDKNADIIKNNYQPYNGVILHPDVEQHFIRLFSFAGLKKNSKILDIGCGNGFLLNQVFIQFKYCELHGLDISSKQLSYAKNIKTYHGNIETININEKFDYIFCMEGTRVFCFSFCIPSIKTISPGYIKKNKFRIKHTSL